MILYTTLGYIAQHITGSAIDLWTATDLDAPPPPDDIDNVPAMLYSPDGKEFIEFAIGHDEGSATFHDIGHPVRLPSLT